MSKFKIKSLGLLTALSLLPSPKAVAEGTWSSGVKVGFSSSYTKPAEETTGVKLTISTLGLVDLSIRNMPLTTM